VHFEVQVQAIGLARGAANPDDITLVDSPALRDKPLGQVSVEG
jgi:hypothetical protein